MTVFWSVYRRINRQTVEKQGFAGEKIQKNIKKVG